MRFAAALLVSVLLFPSCKTAPKKEIVTIIPERIVDVQPSWEGNVQDSGVKGTIPGKGFEISQGALDRYNGLIGLYGETMIPKVIKDTGVLLEDGKIILTPEAMVYFMVMSSQYKNSLKH